MNEQATQVQDGPVYYADSSQEAIESAYAHEGAPGSYLSALDSIRCAVLALAEEVRRRRVVEHRNVEGRPVRLCDDGTEWTWYRDAREWRHSPSSPTAPIPQS